MKPLQLFFSLYVGLFFFGCSDIKFNDDYLRGKWISDYSYEKGDNDTFKVKVFYLFKDNGTIQFDNDTNEFYNWKIKDNPYRLFISQNKDTAEYDINIISLNEFNTIREFNDHIYVHHFKRN